MTQTAAVILNGGQSSRMGTDKSQLTLHGKPLIQIAHKLLQEAGITDIYVSANIESIESIDRRNNYKCILFRPDGGISYCRIKDNLLRE